MTGVSTALRARSYRLFATLVDRGVTPELRPMLAGLPLLAEHLRETGDPDEAAARHYRLFHHEVQPIASVFLERSGRVGGEVTRAATASYGDALASDSGRPPDHLVDALRALAAIEEPERLRAVLDSHLLWWLPLWSATVVRHADPFWTEVVRLLVEVVVDHAVSTVVEAGRLPSGLGVEAEAPFAGSDGPTDLAEVAEYLATPVRSGLHLTPSELRRLSREAGAPAGFGDRRRVTGNLLRSAATYGALPVVAGGVARALATQEREIDERVPGELAHYLAPWRARWDGLRRTLDRLAEAGSA